MLEDIKILLEEAEKELKEFQAGIKDSDSGTRYKIVAFKKIDKIHSKVHAAKVAATTATEKGE